MSNTPKYWKQYITALDKDYRERYVEWAKAKARCEDKWERKPWYKKIWNDGRWELMSFEWREPVYPEPTLVGYYNWDVRERKGSK